MKDEEKKTAERFNIEDDAFYNMFHVGSATECTGLMPSEPLSVEEAKRLAQYIRLSPLMMRLAKIDHVISGAQHEPVLSEGAHEIPVARAEQRELVY